MRRKHNPWISLVALLLLAVIVVFLATGCSPAQAEESDKHQKDRFKIESVEYHGAEEFKVITDTETNFQYLYVEGGEEAGMVRLDPVEVPKALEPEIEEATQAVPKAAEPTEKEPEVISLGEFRVTAYCSCRTCCGRWAENRPVDENGKEIVYTASGTVAKQGRTIAVDPEVIPHGTLVFFGGQAWVTEDTGSAIKGKCIDVYFDNHEDAKAWEVQYHDVSIERE